MWTHLPNANEKIRNLMIGYLDISERHKEGGICSFMDSKFSKKKLDSYSIIEALGVRGYLGRDRHDRHGMNKTRLNFANRVIDNITHPGIKVLAWDDSRHGPYKIVASSKVPGAKQARERIVRFARKNSSW